MPRKIYLKAICLLLPIAGLGLLLRRIGWSGIARDLASMKESWIVLLFVLALLEAGLDGVGFWLATRRRTRIGFGIAANSAGAITNLVLPFEAGEVVKGALARRHIGASAAVSGTVVWNFIFKLTRPLVSLAATLVGLGLFRGLDSRQVTVILGCGAAAFLPYGILRLLIRYGAVEGFLRIVGRLPLLGRHTPRWIDTATTIDVEIRGFTDHQPLEYWLIFAAQILGRLLGWATIHVLLLSLGIDRGFALSSLVFALITVADYLVAVLPARIGVSEGSTYLLFHFLALPPELGVLLYALLRLRTLAGNLAWLPLGLLGGIAPPRAGASTRFPWLANKPPC